MRSALDQFDTVFKDDGLSHDEVDALVQKRIYAGERRAGRVGSRTFGTRLIESTNGVAEADRSDANTTWARVDALRSSARERNRATVAAARRAGTANGNYVNGYYRRLPRGGQIWVEGFFRQARSPAQDAVDAATGRGSQTPDARGRFVRTP